jgi:chitin synthase
MAEYKQVRAAENEELYDDPFADRTLPRQDGQVRFNEPRPYKSTTSLVVHGSHDPYEDEEYIEKQPLNVGQGYSTGFYPPP